MRKRPEAGGVREGKFGGDDWWEGKSGRLQGGGGVKLGGRKGGGRRFGCPPSPTRDHTTRRLWEGRGVGPPSFPRSPAARRKRPFSGAFTIPRHARRKRQCGPEGIGRRRAFAEAQIHGQQPLAGGGEALPATLQEQDMG